jgi:hypothetical protein
MPHGFGKVFDGREYGVNVNQLTQNTPRGTDWQGHHFTGMYPAGRKQQFKPIFQ